MENIYQSMAAIMKSVEAIKKEKTNTQGQGFKYRGIDDVMNSLHKSFSENGVFITSEVIDRMETERTSKNGGALFYITMKIKFNFHAQDGSSISSIISATAMDSGDKADNKALSIGLKYALLQAFLIPTEDMIDPDSQTHEVKSEKQEPKSEPRAEKQKSKPVNMVPDLWAKFIDRLNNGERVTKDGDELIPKIRKSFILSEEQLNTLKIYENEHDPAN